jgi:hypothetical protein
LFFWQRPGLARESGQKNKKATPKAGHGFLGNTRGFWIAKGNPGKKKPLPVKPIRVLFFLAIPG